MTPPDPGGCRPALLIILLSLAAAGRVATAQSLQPQSAGINTGRFLLYPSLTFEYTHDKNVFYRSDDLPEAQRIGSEIYVVRPRLMMELPVRAGSVRWAYAPLYRDYSTGSFDQVERLSHFFDLEGSVRLGRALRLSVRDHLVRATVELQEVDTGGELTFGLVPFRVHTPELEIGLDLGARHGISVMPRYSVVRFDESGETSFFNYRTREAEFRYNYRLDPTSTLYGYYNFQDTDQSRERLLFGDVAVTSEALGIGWQRGLRQTVSARFSAGYQSMEFEGASERNFSGPVASVGVTWRLNDGTSLDFGLERLPLQSFFVNNNFYVTHRLQWLLRQQVGRQTYWQIRLVAHRNVYAEPLDVSVTPSTDPSEDQDMDGQVDAFESLAPSQGVRRRDTLLNVQVGAGWQPLPTLRLFLGYNVETRSSNIEQEFAGAVIDPFRYDIPRLVFRLEAGWL